MGDVTGIWPLTHVGKYQGEVVASNILGESREANYEAVPRVVFTDPQAAAVGAAEATFSATAPLARSPKTETYTRAYARVNGFLTLLSDGERLTGAYALGPEAGEWLQQATLAIRARVPLDVLRDTIQPFPTFSEIYVDALKLLRGEIAAADQPVRRGSRRCHTERSLMRSDIVPGGAFPDYELPDHTNTPRKLSEIQGDDPLILTLARGHYCPKEHQQHLELAAFYPKINVAYTKVATIATDDHHTLQEFRNSVGAQWPFLSDPGRTVQQDLDIQEYTDPDNDPMIPHTLVLKPGLVVHSIYNGYWFWGRPSVVDLWHDLREVTSEIRPDWDLSMPGLREAWDAGDLLAVPRLGQEGTQAGSRLHRKALTERVDRRVHVVVDPSRGEFAALTPDVDRDARLGWQQLGRAPAHHVVLEGAGALVLDDRAMLERDAAAVREERLVELS